METKIENMIEIEEALQYCTVNKNLDLRILEDETVSITLTVNALTVNIIEKMKKLGYQITFVKSLHYGTIVHFAKF